MKITSYRDLEAWQLGMVFVEAVYGVSKQFPRDEQFGLTSQLRRAAVSIPSSISEGHQYRTKAYRHFVTVALGSQAECETQLELARRLKFAGESELRPVIDRAVRLGQILRALRRSLRARAETS